MKKLILIVALSTAVGVGAYAAIAGLDSVTTAQASEN
jgi:hypothetical protein